jgi:hypothetical protein
MTEATTMKTLSACALACVLALAPAAAPEADTITFDGIDTVLDTVGVTIGNVTLTYDGGGIGQAAIGELGPVEWGGVVLGDSVGVLSLAFATPVASFGFDFALDAFADVSDGVIAEVFAADGTLLASVSAAAVLDAGLGLPVGQFLFAGGPMGSANLLFDTIDSQVFLLDNLSTVLPAPEPQTVLLVLAGLIGLAVAGRRSAPARRHERGEPLGAGASAGVRPALLAGTP